MLHTILVDQYGLKFQVICWFYLFVYLFGVLRRFKHCTGHITTGSWKGRGNIEFARVVYCKLPTNGKQLPAFPLKAITGIEPRPQRWEARVLPLSHRGPQVICWTLILICSIRLYNVCIGYDCVGFAPCGGLECYA